MLEIKAFKEEYIDEAARLSAASHERERDRLPIMPERKNIINEVSEAKSALESIGIKEVKSFTGDDVELLIELSRIIQERLEDYNALTKQD